MKSSLEKKDLRHCYHELKLLVEALEELNALYQQQIQEDEHFAGEMADAYRLMMQELYKEHQKIIHFYKALNKNINEFDLDYEDETNYLNKIVDLL